MKTVMRWLLSITYGTCGKCGGPTEDGECLNSNCDAGDWAR